MGLFDGFYKKVKVREITCPSCKNDSEKKKTCVPCRGTGKVKIAK